MRILIRLSIAISVLLSSQGWAGPSAKESAGPLIYQVDKTRHVGHLVQPAPQNAKKGKKNPALLLLPGWWGITSLEKDFALRLSQRGFVVLVADLYGEGRQTMDTTLAEKWMKAAEERPGALDQVVEKSLATLRQLAEVNPDRIALIGFGLGGGAAVERSRQDTNLRGVVNIYGGLKSANQRSVPESSRVRYLVIRGEHESYVVKDDVISFRKEIKKSDADLEVVIYPNTFHEFMRPGIDSIAKKADMSFKYDAHSTGLAWKKLEEFLARRFL